MKKTLFINCNYTYLWIGKVISQLGDKFYSLALAWWILEKTNSPGIMGFYLLVSLLPGLILGLYAGAMVDRLNRKSILITTDILRGFLILFVVIMSMLDLLHVWHVFVISTFISLVTAFFEPTVQAIIPQIVAKEQLKDANSLSQMVNGLCTVLGPILGAIAVSQFGMTYVFLFNGISYFASAILSKLITLNSGPLLQKKTTNILEDVKEGIYYLWRKKEVMRIIIIIAIAHFFFGSLFVLLPFLADSLAGDGVRNLGFIETMLGAGLLAGSIILKKKHIVIKEHSLNVLILLLGTCFLTISIEQLWSIKLIAPYAISILLIGGIVACSSIFWQSLLQLHTPENLTGRIFSVAALAGNTSVAIAYGLFGLFLNFSSLKYLFLVSGICLILISCINIYSIRKSRSMKKVTGLSS